MVADQRWEKQMQLNLTPEQYNNLRALINFALDNIPDEQLTEQMLTDATLYNSLAITNPEFDQE